MYFRRYFSQPWIGLVTVLLLAGFFAAAQAQNKPPASRALPEMIDRANALTDLSSAVPYEMHAQIAVNPGSKDARQGEITIYRDHNRSRTELQLGDFHEVEVVSEGTRYVSRSRPYPLAGLDVLKGVEDAVQLPEQLLADAKIKNRSRTVAGVAASCFDAKRSPVWKTHFCFDSRTGALLEASDYAGRQGRFSGYAAAGEKSFPTKMELTQPGKPRHVELSEIQVTGRKFDDASFAVPQGARVFPVCDGMDTARTTVDSDWTVSRTEMGKVYVYAVVEADGRVHDLTVYGGQKWMEKQVSKAARNWNFFPARCGRTAVASEVLLPLVRPAAEWDYSSGTSSDSYSTSSASSMFDRPQNLNTDINNYINTVTDH
ncbi:MAG TPA: hypothetical protein VHW72_21175 [Candidatus Angelobacter sp.]|jgi:hypothetical protein|nr:hypothetical protein [Candidatus Angelobacter sp.]